jgi:DNA-binding response OmpR family regulator
MAQRNQANNQQPVVCNYQELVEAVWGDPFGHNNNEVTRLVWGIRNKVESDSGESKFIQTVQGRGYLLNIKLLQ